MKKKILVISASPRKGGNSDLLCDQFISVATEAGHHIEKLLSVSGFSDRKISTHI